MVDDATRSKPAESEPIRLRSKSDARDVEVIESESSATGTTGASTGAAVNVQPLGKANITWKRKTLTNLSPGNKKRGRSSSTPTASSLKSITPLERVRDHQMTACRSTQEALLLGVPGGGIYKGELVEHSSEKLKARRFKEGTSATKTLLLGKCRKKIIYSEIADFRFRR